MLYTISKLLTSGCRVNSVTADWAYVDDNHLAPSVKKVAFQLSTELF